MYALSVLVQLKPLKGFRSMKKLIVSVAVTTVLSVGLSGCVNGPTAYGPAQGSSLGFASQQIESNRFHVSFTGRNADEAHNLALLRAAELTKGEGFSHFRVIGSGVDHQSQSGSPVTTSVGIGIGSGSRRGHYGRGSRTSIGVGIGINDIGRAMQGSKVTVGMEIILLNVVEDFGDDLADNVYEADSVIGSVRPQIFTN
ncbi:MAG: hypothetical protein COB56_01260 [Robiginitomaculum sp.]|nr:MAG: hypothetical protein COB56_01260 [Robiginitomaculum sp.]